MGVGFWILPRFWRSRGNEKPAWIAFWLLNPGELMGGLSGHSTYMLLNSKTGAVEVVEVE
jgi:predicted phosphodiesterase